MSVATLNQDEFKGKLGKGRPIVVDFTAVWCAPCRAIAPAVEALAAEHDGTDFVKIDVDDNPELARDLNVMSMPTLVHFDGAGIEVGRTIGVARKELLASNLGLHA